MFFPRFRRRLPRLPVWLFAASAVFALAACSSSKDEAPSALPSQTTTDAVPELEEPPPLPPLPPPIREEEPTPESKVKVIDDGGKGKNEPKTLVEASRLARQQKGISPPPVAEINDDNLSEYAEGGKVTYATSEPAAPAPGSTGSETASAPAGEGSPPAPTPTGTRGEEYWRNGVLELRRSWRQALDDISELELEAAALRQRFYLEDDPYIRDTQVKPSWDRVLDRLSQRRKDAARYEEDLGAFVEEGRQAGALPGWLSEGWELEPSEEEREKYEEFRTHQPGDVDIADPATDVEGGRENEP